MQSSPAPAPPPTTNVNDNDDARRSRAFSNAALPATLSMTASPPPPPRRAPRSRSADAAITVSPRPRRPSPPPARPRSRSRPPTFPSYGTIPAVPKLATEPDDAQLLSAPVAGPVWRWCAGFRETVMRTFRPTAPAVASKHLEVDASAADGASSSAGSTLTGDTVVEIAIDDDSELDAAEDDQVPLAPPPRIHPALAALSVVAIYAVLLAVVAVTAPPLTPSQRQHIRLPHTIAQLKQVAGEVAGLASTHRATVMAAYAVLFTFLQTFAIPGSLMLTLLAGALYPLPVALLLVSACSAIGASACYILARACGRAVVSRLSPLRVAAWRHEVDRHAHDLLPYMVFLRVTPLFPNWLVNVTAPHLGVPLRVFFAGTFLGVMPPGFVYVHAGASLQDLTEDKFRLWTPLNVAAMGMLGALSLLPVLVGRRRRARRGPDEEEVQEVVDGERAPLLG
ncbi:hypothetical protein GGF32_001353 [Allomyces javanicus]|nr:hypothetical protein GGF32_001353 [Allomyces javanicus]